jgi:superfamily II DNA helicase RecQ
MAAPRIQKAEPTNAPADGSTRALYAISAQLRRIADHLEGETPEGAVSEPESTASPQDEQLFQSLRQWRADEARKLGMPPYIVATDRVLRAVAQTRPATVEDLRKVPGVGPAKAEKYGERMVQLVATA